MAETPGQKPLPDSAPSPPPRSPRRRSGVVVPERVTFAGRATARLLWAVVQGVDATLRYRLTDPSDTLDTVLAGPVIFALWHSRLPLSLRIYRRYVQRERPGRRLAAMVSASRDGGMLARVLDLFGVQPVRGSSSRRGAQALLEMTSWAGRGHDLAITPDGPRGPRYVVQDGVVDVAAISGLPVIPVGYDLSRQRRLKSWDRMLVPLPFATCEVRLGEALRVPREMTDSGRDRLRLELEARLMALTDRGASPFGAA